MKHCRQQPNGYVLVETNTYGTLPRGELTWPCGVLQRYYVTSVLTCLACRSRPNGQPEIHSRKISAPQSFLFVSPVSSCLGTEGGFQPVNPPVWVSVCGMPFIRDHLPTEKTQKIRNFQTATVRKSRGSVDKYSAPSVQFDVHTHVFRRQWQCVNGGLEGVWMCEACGGNRLRRLLLTGRYFSFLASQHLSTLS